MTNLWLVRHGQTDWNLTGRWQGQAEDAPGLNETGYTQAYSAREQLKGVPITAIYSSDLLRSRQTAELIAEPSGLTVNLEPRLREINLGAWGGCFLKILRINIRSSWKYGRKIHSIRVRQGVRPRLK